MEKVLIIGANGHTGRIIATKLKDAASYIPVAMIRDAGQKDYFEEMGVQTCLGDLEEEFESCYKTVDKVIFVAGSGSSTGKDKTESIDKDGAQKSVDLAKKHGIKKYVMLSSMGAEDPDPDSGMHHYLSAKNLADEHLKKSGVPYAIVRPGALTHKNGTGKIKAAFQLEEQGEIPREDVASVMIHCLDRDYGTGLTFEILSGDQDIPTAIEGLRQV
ncbi:SDR family oxidoreductase [Litoribacter alkaliphilus]|uniref:SDR family oxidoreductase n=1 Tax=Litoribacter ruber TaxID=702568 RepID=A0AAP2CHR4_9BACT|nr:SDR family oxidoreductase [Litoribacter alkaliphilus]MBS9523959.1 SDR family oxidoreductase [Litoribacter alkaliphilus]